MTNNRIPTVDLSWAHRPTGPNGAPPLPPRPKRIHSPLPGADMWQYGGCRVIVAQEPARSGALRWHLSISHPDRYPTWDEIRDARYTFTPPDVTMVMVLPPPSQYVNLHPNCFQLHEVPEAAEVTT